MHHKAATWGLCALGLLGASCNPLPQQALCDEAERAGLLWSGRTPQAELERAWDAGDPWVGYNGQLGCWYVD